MNLVQNVGAWEEMFPQPSNAPLLFAPVAHGRYESTTADQHIAFTPEGIQLTLLDDDGVQTTSLLIRYTKNQPPLVWQPIGNPTAVEHRYIGQDWQTNLPLYTSLHQPNLYPGIDLVVSSADGHLKSDFHLAPHADPAQIAFFYEGAESLWLDEAGQLHIATAVGTLIEEAPLAWQEIDGQHTALSIAFTLEPETHTVRFALGDYDPTHPLIIDPILTYFRPTTHSAITSDDEGNVYVAEGALQIFTDDFGNVIGVRGGLMRFTKLDGTGRVLYRTTVGGRKLEYFGDMVLDQQDRLFFSGRTSSPDFPTTGNAPDKTCGTDSNCNSTGIFDRYDAVVGRLGVDGRLEYATFWGGPFSEFETEIALDKHGRVYLGGFIETPTACSPNCDYSFPTTPGVLGPSAGDAIYNTTAFLMALDMSKPPTQAVQYSTLVRLADQVDDLAADSTGRALLQDGTAVHIISPTADQITKTLNLPGYYVNRIHLTADDKLYSVGDTSTSGLATSGAPDTTLGGPGDGYVARQDLDGNLEFFTYIGGSSADYGRYLALRGNKLFVAGFTFSTNFPTINPLDTAVTNNQADLFLIAYTLNSSGSGATANWATTLGGDANERLYGLAPYSDNEVWLAAEALDDTFWPRKGLFISRINGQHGLNLHVSHTVAQNPVALGQTLAYTTTIANYGSKDAQNVVVTGTLPSNTYWDITLSRLPIGDCAIDDSAHTYACAFATLPKGTVHQLFFRGPTKQYGAVTHTAEISGLATDGSEDVVPEDDTAVVLVNIRTGLGIGVTAPTAHTSGEPLTATLTITNYGPDPMTDVFFSQSIAGQGHLIGSPIPRDPNLTPPCVLSGTPVTSVQCGLANPIPAGTTLVFDAPISTTKAARDTLTHTVTIEGKSATTNVADLDTSDNSDQALTKLTPPGADVAVNIKDIDGTAGQPLTFTLTITNFGGEIADNVIITTTFGTPTTTFALVSASIPANPACTYSQPTGQPATHTCNFGHDPLYANTSRTIQFVVVPLKMGPLSPLGRPVIKATATVTATAVTLDDNGTATPTGHSDPDPHNNEHDEFIGIDAGYDLEVNLESAANPQPYQEPFTLTAKLLNVGAETARAITFTVGIPISLTYNSHTAATSDLACTYASGTRTLTCTAPEQETVAAGGDELAVRLNLTAVQTGTIGLPLEARAAAGYSDYLSQDTGNGEKAPDNNSGLFTIQVENDAKLSLTAFQLPADGRVGTGERITYTVRLKNDGPKTAENISLTMIWTPVGENPVPTSYPSFCNPVGTNVLECTPPNLARGESSPTYQFVAQAPANIASTPVQAQLNMLATATASQKAANAKLFTKILRKAQLEIGLSDSQDPAPTSQPYTITVNVHNLSTHPSTVTTATLTAVGYNFDAATLRSKPQFCTVTNGFQMTCTLGTLGDNQFKTFELGLNAPTESGSRTVLGRVSSSTLMPLKATASEQTTFRPERRVAVSLTAVPSSTVKPNERLTLHVNLHNQSNDPATKLELTFRGNYPLQNVALPSGVTCAPTTVSTAPLLPAFKCNLPDLAGNTTAVYSFQLTVPRGKDSLTHFATLQIFEINRASNSDVKVSLIQKEVDLAITKLTDTPDPVGKGDTIQYEAKIHNNSAITATNVTATFAVPDATLFSATSAVTCNINSNGHIATCTFPSLPPYTSQELAFRATVPASTSKDSITAGLDVQGAERDPVTGNNGKVVDTAVEEQHDLNFTTAQTSGAPAPSDKIVFIDLAVRNSANGTAKNVLVKPTLTPNLQLVKLWHFTGAANSTECPQTGCQLGNIAQNENKTLRVVVRVVGPVNDGDTATVTLTATAENSGEKTPTDNTQATTFDLTNQADMSASLATADGQPLVAGKNGTLRLTLKNNGPAEAQNVVATITLPQDISAVASQNPACSAFVHSFVCTLPKFQQGEEWFDVTIKPAANLRESDTRQANYTLTSKSDPQSGNDSGAGTLAFKTEVDLSIVGQALPENLGAQETAVGMWVITNLGPSDAQSYQVNFEYGGNELEITAVDDPACTINNNGSNKSVACTINDPLSAGTGSKTIKLTVRATGDGFATIKGTTSHPNDTTAGNGLDTIDFTIEDKSDLAVAQQTFTIAPHYIHNTYATLLNAGPETARDASLKITLPSDLVVHTISGFSGGDVGTGCTTNGQLLECTVKNLPSGSTFRVNFTVKTVNGTAKLYVGQITAGHNNAQIDPHLFSNNATILFNAQGPR